PVDRTRNPESAANPRHIRTSSPSAARNFRLIGFAQRATAGLTGFDRPDDGLKAFAALKETPEFFRWFAERHRKYRETA
ncbi:MAG: hypothetical protein ABIN37_11970, partial [Burkholderiaceae bacterium]